MSFQTILKKYREESFSQSDKGTRFERLMYAYLQTDPNYAFRFDKVWMWNEFPGRNDLGGADTGIDLVAVTHSGEYWAIQCKCYQEGSIIDKPAVDSFLSTSSRQFKGEDLKTTSFTHRLWIDTTGRSWGKNAEEAIRNQRIPVTRIGLFALEEAPVDWSKIEKGLSGEDARTEKYDLRSHQQEALDNTDKHFKEHDRGKLIMACGTGKTFTSLRIAEHLTDDQGLVLFLVPSIALLGQTLREWSAQARKPIDAICICSDPEISTKKKKGEDADFFSTIDLALPASTDVDNIIRQFEWYEKNGKGGMTVVFSTYQSIDVIAQAQQSLVKKTGKGAFDLIICDEAHRTTGVTLSGEDESAFTKVHDNDFLDSKKRIYMTATPRLYSDDTKSRAAQAEAVLCSMDDVSLYGEEMYRIGFGEAVEKDLLSDYKVLVLTLNENDVPPAIQQIIADKKSEINTDDASKLIGCVNALSKQVLGDEGIIKETDPDPMARAVAFCQKITVSKKITNTFNTGSNVYIDSLPTEKRGDMVSVASKHIDGTMTAPERDELLGWLKAGGEQNECRVLTNVRCLSEGVDVPSLDAVMFLSARNSQVDVVQSVGRVMRKSPGKKYGYIIIPVVVPADVEADKALDDNERYKVVWTVLNALRAHDDRFNATVNKIELNKQRPENILIGRPEYMWDEHGNPIAADPSSTYETNQEIGHQLAMQFEQLQSVMFARMVKKVGDRHYWEQWAKSVAEIAERQIARIKKLVSEDTKHKAAFKKFLSGLQKNINDSITEQEAIEMLSQHIITKPVFEALFEGYSFVKNNPISTSMQNMLDLLEEQSLDKDQEALEKFYAFVKRNVADLDNAEAKQTIILRLYDNFFKVAFKKLVERLGIVYTPVEVVDFIIHSVNDVLQQEFGRNLSDEDIHVLDPFTGTGTFITRLLQSGLIKQSDLNRKYHKELHANEIVLLAYYIAAVNIENVYHDLKDSDDGYEVFDGICLTDTFQLGEIEDSVLFSEMFPKNSERLAAQKRGPIRVIMGNPPYSIGQKSANDNAQNQKYPILDSRVASTYAARSTAGLSKSLYDAYIKAFRWSSDRLDPSNGGVVAFVSNGKWLDANSTDGFRLAIEDEFSSIYVFDLRGDQRGDWRKEGGKIFGEGSQNRIAVTFLIKKPDHTGKAKIFYHDIGDYLSREEKLTIIKDFKSMGNPDMIWKHIKPNKEGDWLNQRNEQYDTFIPLAPDKKFNANSQSFFVIKGPGISTGRDPWVYNSSEEVLCSNMSNMINFYNVQRKKAQPALIKNPKENVSDLVESDPKSISWTRALRNDVAKNVEHEFDKDHVRQSMYRPFFKQPLYSQRRFIESPGLWDTFFPDSESENWVIALSGKGSSKDFSCLISTIPTCYDFVEKTQCYPMYFYQEPDKTKLSLFDNDGGGLERRDAISDFILKQAQTQYGKNVDKESIFFYVYGLLHSEDYRKAFSIDLKKMLPKIPLVEKMKDFWAFSNAGKKLAEIHTQYENLEPHPEVKVDTEDGANFKVDPKMRFANKDSKDTIALNSKVRVSNIPDRAYDYKVNGKSAIEWLIERYQIKVDKDSGIINNPNELAEVAGNPRYILDLLLKVISMSTATLEIVDSLPSLEFVKSDIETIDG